MKIPDCHNFVLSFHLNNSKQSHISRIIRGYQILLEIYFLSYKGSGIEILTYLVSSNNPILQLYY